MSVRSALERFSTVHWLLAAVVVALCSVSLSLAMSGVLTEVLGLPMGAQKRALSELSVLSRLVFGVLVAPLAETLLF